MIYLHIIVYKLYQYKCKLIYIWILVNTSCVQVINNILKMKQHSYHLLCHWSNSHFQSIMQIALKTNMSLKDASINTVIFEFLHNHQKLSCNNTCRKNDRLCKVVFVNIILCIHRILDTPSPSIFSSYYIISRNLQHLNFIYSNNNFKEI